MPPTPFRNQDWSPRAVLVTMLCLVSIWSLTYVRCLGTNGMTRGAFAQIYSRPKLYAIVPKLGLGRATPPPPTRVVEETQGAFSAAPAPASEVSYIYVVFVADNDVNWAYDRDYVLITHGPLEFGKTPQEFLSMLGRKSLGPGKRYWVQSSCSVIVRVRNPSDDPKVDAGVDYVHVGTPATNWVVT
ncbi:hypothetical protein F5Y18DRAFT_249636 [Xylariaceae sp. FL1019]|nr:hypothetical protein F5Y18DRAFT_249636 [Xylariaceae sp. FL1019]